AGVVIHPTAVIEPGAELAPDVRVGPYSVIGRDVTIGAGAEIGAHVVLEGRTRLGARCPLGPGALHARGAAGGGAHGRRLGGARVRDDPSGHPRGAGHGGGPSLPGYGLEPRRPR